LTTKQRRARSRQIHPARSRNLLRAFAIARPLADDSLGYYLDYRLWHLSFAISRWHRCRERRRIGPASGVDSQEVERRGRGGRERERADVSSLPRGSSSTRSRLTRTWRWCVTDKERHISGASYLGMPRASRPTRN
jgi:hypothetical protein